MSYFGIPLRSGLPLGLSTIPTLTATPLSYRLAPSLDLSFAGSDALSPAITFSRTTNATLTNSAGLVANAPMNLLTFSEQFDNSYWGKIEATVSANQIAAPDGTFTADKILTTAVNSSHVVFKQTVGGTGVSTLSVYAKAGEYSWLFMSDTNSTSNGANFNLATGVLGTVGSNATATITSVGNGWYRCTVTLAAYAGGGIGLYAQNANNVVSFVGSVTSGIYIWGAQLELGSAATTYNPTTVKNLLGFTENFDNAAWTKSNASISATKVDDIYGQPFAQKLVENTANSTHFTRQAISPIANGVYTFSVYAKAAERSFIILQPFNDVRYAFFNLATGVVGSVNGSPLSTSIQSVGDGWYRCSITAASSGTTGDSIIYVSNANGTVSYTGDGTSGIYIFGAQLSDSASVDPYVYQPVAAPSSVAYYGPRFDYDPVTLAPKGLLIEEQRTQLLLNSSLAGTSLATQNVTVAAVAHTLSFYGTGTVTLSGVSTAGPLVGTGAYPNRATLTFTPTAGTLTLTVTGTVQFAQLEAGAFATSFIPSAASQVTRAADSASMIGNNFARWYNQTEGTVYLENNYNFGSDLNAGSRIALQIDNGSASDRFILSNGGFANSFIAQVGGVTQAAFNGASNTANFVKTAFGYATNNMAMSNAGSAPSTDTSCVVPIVNTMRIGMFSNGALQLSGNIKRIAYYNRRLSNTELQGITA